jgi:hypothetical protein
MNNRDHRCCLNTIDVDGPDAVSRNETCCASFVNRAHNMQNSSAVEDPHTELEITCRAEKCVHHCGEHCCNADCVCVGTYSHHTKGSAQTQCETFATSGIKNIHKL